MRSRHAWTAASVLAVASLTATSAFAQQSLNFSAGYFTVRGEDARVDDDVLVANRNLFLFDFNDFNSASLGVEWLVPIGEYLEAGAGVNFTTRGVNTIYDDYVRPDGSEIDQQLKLRIVPLTATIRILPLGRHAAVQPYVGGGIGVHFWRYAETGDFVDFSQAGRPVFRDSFVATGTVGGAGRGLRREGARRQCHDRRGSALPESGWQPRRTGLPRIQDRSRRVPLPGDGGHSILKAASGMAGLKPGPDDPSPASTSDYQRTVAEGPASAGPAVLSAADTAPHSRLHTRDRSLRAVGGRRAGAG